MLQRVDTSETREQRAAVEVDLRGLLFKAVSSPLMELVLRITTQFYKPESDPPVFSSKRDITVWKNGRRNILQAILESDEELARFEAERFRRQVMQRLLQQK